MVAGMTIKPKESAKYLGVYIDSKLTFKEHVEYAEGKGVKAATALTRLANTTSGMPHKFIRRLFIGLVVPRMEYTLPMWYNPVREGEGRRQGAVGIARRMSKPQRLACKVMAGGLRSTSTEALDYHANILPTHLRMNLAAYKFAVRLCTLPPSHPLQKVVERCKRIPRLHRSPIHHLMSAFKDLHNDWETIKAGSVDVVRSQALKFSIPDTKKSAEQDVAKLPKGDRYIYSDGSGFKAKIGAAAWMQPLESTPNREVQRLLHLGPDTHHTVFEAELVGALLAIDIIKSTPCLTKATILLDSQAAILALQSGKTKSGRYLVEEFHNQVRKLQASRKTLRIRIQWVPGHVSIDGNESADSAAKEAALGTSTLLSNPSILSLPLPRSKAAAIAAFSKQTKCDWADYWNASPKGKFTKCIDSAPPSAKVQRLYSSLGRTEASLLTQLRTAHIPLNNYLHKSKATRSRMCEYCNVPETVSHFLLTCRRYSNERQALRRRTKITNLQLCHLISANSKHIHATISFINKTGRLPNYFKSNEDHPPP
ncbi:uncharacterized protein ARMOST_12678 [Armillaria ostoyae]|uniref:ribonuclease H n=1 Tax=Armillaria ostoyae TaxID=47428 RepID=A0A284RKN1_ARMOS|nr:uncharacterized protein ARMOST_12678 [Armillaria ostoyae]